jgi:dephospho-CoA kinase
MKYLVTGTLASGKSTIGKLLKKKGYKFVDIDYEKGLAGWFNKKTGKRTPSVDNPDGNWFDQHDWNWDRSFLKNILKNYNEKHIFVCGVTSNTAENVDLFDKVLLLKVSQKRLRKRMIKRGDTDIERVFVWYKSFEQGMLDRGAVVIDAEQKPEVVAQDILNQLF